MERLADANAERAPTRFIVSNDPEEIAAGIRQYAELGFDELILHAPGEDQGRFLDQFGEDVLPLLR
jgi:coenzyme F420-dependent glucose-6-phosphate dehydrogenase